ncbi:Uma2 family endonuclease [Saccharopolyspora spinosa]|uniref:Uma2 family endonuclease n=1 Tax=Saccharopolyspora spinosa TaxID=60894 RepID=UPI00023797E8|nr:Uma2 family endonuclease [Saccharopolyspora spinosa]
MTTLPDWMRPPRTEGWFAEDLDRLPEAPRHTELIDGALVFMVTPQRSWRGRLVTGLTVELARQAPDGIEVEREMTIRLDARNRPEPDLLVTTAPFDPDRTWYELEEYYSSSRSSHPSPRIATARSSCASTPTLTSGTTGTSRTKTRSRWCTSTSWTN